MWSSPPSPSLSFPPSARVFSQFPSFFFRSSQRGGERISALPPLVFVDSDFLSRVRLSLSLSVSVPFSNRFIVHNGKKTDIKSLFQLRKIVTEEEKRKAVDLITRPYLLSPFRNPQPQRRYRNSNYDSNYDNSNNSNGDCFPELTSSSSHAFLRASSPRQPKFHR